jgi:hypothetical protein
MNDGCLHGGNTDRHLLEHFHYWCTRWKGTVRGRSVKERPHRANLGQGTVIVKML